MAAVASYFIPTDMTQINLNLFAQNSYNTIPYYNVTIAGITYPTAIEVDAVINGVNQGFAFLGPDLKLGYASNGAPYLVGGTVTGVVFLAQEANGSVKPVQIFQNFSVPSSTVYNAFVSPTTDDDYALFKQIFSGNDYIQGSEYNDNLISPSANANILARGGNDRISGNGGLNTSEYQGNATQYSISHVGDTWTIADQNVSRDGTDTLTNIQQAKFTDYTILLFQQEPLLTSVYQLYQAAFARTPDLGGLAYWGDQVGNKHVPILDVANMFVQSAEFTAAYGSNMNNSQYAMQLYKNVLGRAPDADGLKYWVDALDHGFSRAATLNSFASSPENVTLVANHVDNGYWTVA